MNDCLVCDKETIMYNNYQICHHCFKKIFHINKSNKQYINDLPNYLIKISKLDYGKQMVYLTIHLYLLSQNF